MKTEATSTDWAANRDAYPLWDPDTQAAECMLARKPR
jgi:hypothetical protein